MGFVDYLAFIQVSIAFNFAAAYWKERNEDDAIRKLFRELHNWDKIKEDFEKIKFEEGIVDDYRPVSSNGEDTTEEWENKMIRFYWLKNNWNIVNQKLSYQYSSLLSKDHYTFFNHVCILLALYGFFQLFMLPDVCEKGYEILHNSYLFITEIMIIILALLLGFEFIQKVEPFSKILKIDFISRVPLLGSVLMFILIVALGFLFSFSLEWGWRTPWTLDFCESDLIYSSIFLSYLSFIVYFLLNLWNFGQECWSLNMEIPELERERLRLLWKIKKL